MAHKPITGIDFSGAGDFYPKVNEETSMKLGELGWPNSAINKANNTQLKPLTDEQIGEIAVLFYPRGQGHEGFARAIEAAHGIK
jgi:hypothetical protein